MYTIQYATFWHSHQTQPHNFINKSTTFTGCTTVRIQLHMYMALLTYHIRNRLSSIIHYITVFCGGSFLLLLLQLLSPAGLRALISHGGWRGEGEGACNSQRISYTLCAHCHAFTHVHKHKHAFERMYTYRGSGWMEASTLISRMCYRMYGH